jgi:succinate dehydrogenase / fumarate reductase membrane anchor subunit
MRRSFTGLRAWVVQRISAILMLLFIVFILAHFVVDPPNSYQAWHSWMMSFSVSIVTTAFFAALLAHAWVGLRDVLLDYVHAIVLRAGLLAVVGFVLTALGIWVMRILWIGRL